MIKKFNANKPLYITLAIVVAVVIIGGIVAIKYFTGADRKIIKALENENYEEAVEIYNSDANGDASKRLTKSLKGRLEKIKTDFSEKTVEFEVADMELKAIEKMNISEISSSLKSVKDYVSKLNASRTAYSTAETMFGKEDYAGAINNYKKVIEDDSEYESAKAKLSAAAEKYREQELKTAADYVAQADYNKAIAEIEGALKTVPEDARLTEQLELYNNEYSEFTKKTALEAAKEAADGKKYAEAVKTLTNALISHPDDVDISGDLKNYTQSYIDSVIAKVNKSTGKRDYNTAVKLLEDALELLPENKTLTEKLEKVEANKPVLLSSLKTINGGWNWNEGTPIDPFGNIYSSASNFAIFEDGSYYAEYRVYGKYKTLTGDLISHEDIPTNGSSQIKVYKNDGEIIYTSPSIVRKSDVRNFSVDISDADYIKIEISSFDDDVWNSHNCLIMMNVQLWAE